LQTLALMSALTFLPAAILLAMTAFTRIIIDAPALGAVQSHPNRSWSVSTLFLTALIMTR
jgi:flagellar biosynthesis protein FliP